MRCRHCGCTDDRACPGGCWWVAPEACSSCVGGSLSAVISPCGLYRYRLDRSIQLSGNVTAYFGVNPSTADAVAEDQTTRKWRGFSLRNDCRRYIVGNLFALRSTDVRGLAAAEDPIGPANDQYLEQIIAEADVLVPCWGSAGKVPARLRPRLEHMKQLLASSGKPVRIFGLTKSGDPLHPLTLAYRTPLQSWSCR